MHSLIFLLDFIRLRPVFHNSAKNLKIYIHRQNRYHKHLNPPKIKKPIVAFQNPILIVSTLVLLFLGSFSVFSHSHQNYVESLQSYLLDSYAGFYSFIMNLSVCFCMLILLSPLGGKKLGADQDKPEFSNLSWIAMLFSGGMGIGLLFFGVLEPLSHHFLTFQNEKAVEESLTLTILHWGIHPWSLYAMCAIPLGYFSFSKKAPMLASSCFSCKTGTWKHTLLESTTIVFPVLAVALALGVGASQICSGIDFTFNTKSSITTQFIAIAVISVLSTGSVLSGLYRGVKILSNLNILLASLLFLYLVSQMTELQVLRHIGTDFFHYMKSFLHYSFEASNIDYKSTGAVLNWTTYYWAVWIAWCPSVGRFIARISKGRTLREVILGVVLIPTVLSGIWFSVIGRSAIESHSYMNREAILNFLSKEPASSFFSFLSNFQGASLLNILSVVCLTLFFITSSDSASYVIAKTASYGNEPSKFQKIYWSSLISILASILIFHGGLKTMQFIVILSAFPFGLVCMGMALSFIKSHLQK